MNFSLAALAPVAPQFVLMGVVLGLLLLRRLLILFAAEQGRKQDLVKRLLHNNQEFQLSVLIPYLDPNEHPVLLTLLQAIAEQEYPAAKVAVHLVATAESARDLIPQSLQPNVKVWEYPNDPHPRAEHATKWLIERCLAAGGNGMFVFLRPTDIVKPDFFRNVAARGLDSFVLQGYVAQKNMPQSLLEKVVGLSHRLFNRIGNAGRYHLGMSCRLLESGWAIKQEVLEMIPYARGLDFDNLEYSLRLNLEGFKVNWAPSVVVYADSRISFLHHITLCVGTVFNRLRLLLNYAPRLLTRMIARFDLSALELAFSTLKPPAFIPFMLLVALAVLDYLYPDVLPGDAIFWIGAAVLVFATDLLALAVGRCKVEDYFAMSFYAPVVMVLGLLASPLALVIWMRDTMLRRAPQGATYRRARKTRFNEDLDTPPALFDDNQGKAIHRMLKRNAPAESTASEALLNEMAVPPKRKKAPASAPVAPISEKPLPLPAADDLPVPRARLPKETVRAVPMSNGKKQIQCVLKTRISYDEAGEENIQLTLEYKNVAFSTAAYRIPDQAFYELHSKLVSRGLTLITCGSCGYFYNPTADVPGALKNAGVCLFGKQGREVNLNTDAVTVLSQSCAYHCPISQRESIVRQWKESQSLSRAR